MSAHLGRAPRFSFRLAALALRRALDLAALVWTAAVAIALVSNDWRSEALSIEAGEHDSAASLADGLTRQGLWSGFCLAIVPFVTVRAAGIVGRWRARGEVDWLGSRASGRTAIAGSTLVGTLVGAWILAIAWWTLGAVCVGGGGSMLQAAGEVPAPGGTWVDGTHALAWSIEVPSHARTDGARVRIELGLGSGAGPATEVVCRARGTAETTSARTRIGTRGSVEVALPIRDRRIELELSVTDPAARVLVLSNSACVWIPTTGGADRAITLRLCLACIAWIALAFGFGAWVSTPTAAFGVSSLWIAAWLSDTSWSWIPGIDLFDALSIVAQGRVPSAIDVRQALGALAALAIGIALTVSSLARWRRVT